MFEPVIFFFAATVMPSRALLNVARRWTPQYCITASFSDLSFRTR